MALWYATTSSHALGVATSHPPSTSSGRLGCPPVAVLQGVPLQQRAVGEGAVADATGEGALHAVRAHVHVERALLREALGADGTLEGAHARVHHHVLEEVVA